MNITRQTLFIASLLLLIAFVLVADLFYHNSLPATFDGRVHITMIAQFYQALRDGDFPVTWASGFANYGMPMPIIHQQVPIYLGAVLNFFVHNVVVANNLVYFIAALLSLVGTYLFLRLHFPVRAAIIGSIFFNFAPYRIFNIYTRGALPEFFAAAIIPFVLIGINKLIAHQNVASFLFLSLSLMVLILSHPFMLVIGGVVFLPYSIYLLYKRSRVNRSIILLILAVCFGVVLSGYYLIPLVMEIKYFYYGLASNHFAEGHFLGIREFIDPRWYYFYEEGEFTRGNFIKVGLLESIVYVVGFVLLIRQWLVTKQIPGFIATILFSGLLLIYLMLPWSAFLYRNINFLSSIQHPWRMLSAFMFIPAILVAWFFDNKKSSRWMAWLGLLFVALIIVMRVPQLYSKNGREYSSEEFVFTTENLSAVVLNTIWTGLSEEYPIKDSKGEIIEGKGQIIKREERNSSRRYKVLADEKIRMADYTFYFPGWNVYIDGEKLSLRDVIWQDPNYRGVITYYVSKGEHEIEVVFENTKVRMVGYIISLVSVVVLIAILIIKPKRFT